MTAPTIYDLRNDRDAARFGLQPWERDYLLKRCFPNRNGQRIEALLFHIQDGTTLGSLDWWVNGPGVQASSTIIANKDGSLINVIAEKDGPWTNGKVSKPSARAAELLARGGNPNLYSATCEAEGRPWHAIPEVQMEAMVWWADDMLRRYPHLDAERDILAHYDIDSVDRSQCGLYVDQLKANLRGDHRPKAGYGTITRYPAPVLVTVTAQAGLNYRQWGDTDAQIYGTLPYLQTFFAVGHVIGDAVAGEQRWYILAGAAGYRAWAGGTNRAGIGD